MQGCSQKQYTGVGVAVDNATPRFDALYDYRVPESLAESVAVGSRVAVPFGRGNAPRTGIILEKKDVAESTKEVFYIEQTPVLNEEFVKLVFALKDYTLCTYFDAIKTLLPRASRVEPYAVGDGFALADIFSGYTETVYEANKTYDGELTTRRAEVVNAAQTPMTFAELRVACGVTRATVAALVECGALKKSEALKRLEDFGDSHYADIPSLTPSQTDAYKKLAASRDAGRQALLFGVTSSGKTLVYIKLIEDCISSGRGAIVLVPEIALSGQMIARLRSLFGRRVGVIHSALSETERQLHWLAIKSGECDIVVGTRSAVFAPVRNLGLIIIDEEQEHTYYSEQSPRYSAGSIARLRASYNNAFLLLASATPSVETYYKAKRGSIDLATLDRRYNDYPLPSVKLVDMQNELAAGNASPISRYLQQRIDERLQSGEQSILLLNRRGYRTVIMCEQCRKIVKCDSCDVPLVLHKQTARCICHYCGAAKPPQDKCPDCGGDLRYKGIGTQGVEEELSALFPSARIARMDVDSTSRKNSSQEYLDAFSRGEYDILIGTQMIAKGLDFPNVTLIGVQSVDAMMTLPSYKAYERAFAMLTQVIGRSGRGGKPSEAIIQTLDPHNEIMSFARRQDYEGFFENEIAIRKAHLYPPFCAICTVGFISDDEQTGTAAAEGFVDYLLTGAAKGVPLRILGPSPFRIAVVNNMYRCKLRIKCRGDREFRELLRGGFERFGADKRFLKVRVFADFGADSDF